MALTIPVVWSDDCRLHDPAAEIWIGVRTPAVETAARTDVILEELRGAGTRIVDAAAHDDTALHAMHDPELRCCPSCRAGIPATDAGRRSCAERLRTRCASRPVAVSTPAVRSPSTTANGSTPSSNAPRPPGRRSIALPVSASDQDRPLQTCPRAWHQIGLGKRPDLARFSLFAATLALRTGPHAWHSAMAGRNTPLTLLGSCCGRASA